MNAPFPKLPPQGRIKPKYSPILTAQEKAHEKYVQAQPCFGCGAGVGVEAHHTLLNFSGKRFRRDHRFRLPVCDFCHRGTSGIHGIGSEPKWLEAINRTVDQAVAYMKQLWAESQSAWEARK